MIRKIESFVLIIVVALLWTSLIGAEEKLKVGEVVVTASRIEEAVEETTSSVTVVKREAIQRMNVNFVPDVLRLLPDIQIVQNGGDGKLASLFIRGGAPADTIVMIDGIKVNSPTTGVYDFSGISVDDIERIEIVKGPQSTIYGSEAMAGVINIITRKGEGKPKADLLLEGGSFGTYKGVTTLSGSVSDVSYRVTMSYFNTQGISVAKDGTERDGYRNANISWKFGARPSKNSEVELFGNYYYDRSELDDFDYITQRMVDDPFFVQHGWHFLLGGRGKLYLTDKWEQILTLSTSRDLVKFRDADTPLNNADMINMINRREIVDWQNNFFISDAMTLTGGVEYRREKGENKGNYQESIDNKAPYLNIRLKVLNDRLVFNAGVRHDEHETAGGKTTYRFGTAYTLRDADLILRGSYGTGFRAPSLDELFFPFFGNPNLKPEETKGFEVGAEKFFFNKRASLSLTYFHQDYDNLIQYDFLTSRTMNVAKAEIKGFEVGASVKISDSIHINAGYTNLDTRDKEKDQRLTRRPNDMLHGGVEYAARDLSVRVDFLYVGKRLDTASGSELSSYSLFNMSGNYSIKKNFVLFARVENLFNEKYEEVGGYGTKGASFYGGMKVTF